MPKKEKQYEVTTQAGERVYAGSFDWGTPSMEALQRVACDLQKQNIVPAGMKVKRFYEQVLPAEEVAIPAE